ncbi:uncharacterized protein LOC135473908 [Liolophura sinensis]|uniref:uncharacterized protein LOC135473908 n=1 Tax=Liolophura sinensis TaxID=3198878 RepID=UPI00315965F7
MAAATTLVFLLSVVTPLTQAWWIFGNKERPVQAVGAVDPDCIRHAELGSCEFYACLERRFPCGTDSYPLTHGAYYCHKFQNYLHMFNEQGRRWVRNSRQCLTRNLRATYTLSEVTCRDISRERFRTVSNCFVSRGFCSIMWNNKEALLKVFEAEDLVDRQVAIRVWREIFDIARGCAGRNIERFIEWALDTQLPLHG